MFGCTFVVGVVMAKKSNSELKGNEAALLLEKEIDKIIATCLKDKKKK